jgi:hypothetical protein
VFRAYTLLAEVYEGRGDKAAATKVYGRIIEAFNKGGYEKNGAEEATAAAMATFMLMRPRYEAFMATTLVENTKLPVAKRAQDVNAQVSKMMDVLMGPEVKVKADDGSEGKIRCADCPPGNKLCREQACKADQAANGMAVEYENAVAFYGSAAWSYAAYLYRGRMLKYFARTIYDAPRPEMDETQVEEYEDFLERLGGKFENLAIKGLKAALDNADANGVVNSWVTELRAEMNRYRPKEYPLLREEKRAVADPPATLPMVEKELR